MAQPSQPSSQEYIRNICIIAHVDHGKTTCADNLVASNGIISRHSAGKIRYMDSRTDEQERQITMKSSSIALQWRSAPDAPAYTANLIDSPGHVDFTSEVSTAARLADGALVVVDVVEGVAAQTRTVLRQAWRDRVRTCLLLNKVDRLIVELELTPLEAYQRILKILEQVNAVNQQLVCEEVMAKDADAIDEAARRAVEETEAAAVQDGIDLASGGLVFDTAEEEALTYSPERGNVAFGSASHGWAFTISSFAKLIAAKMGAKPENMQRVLWGEWSFNKKTRRAQRRSPSDTKSKPMFVEFVLQQIFAVYEASYRSINDELLAKMQSQIAGWKDVDIKRLSAGSSAVRDLMSRWQPFADCILRMAATHLPSPKEAAASRLPVLCPRWFAAGDKADRGPIMQSLQDTDAAGPTVVYLAKFLAADLERCVLTGDTLIGDEDVRFVGLCRIFSGTLRPGSELYISTEDGKEATKQLAIVRVFTLKGRFLEAVDEAPAGWIVAVEVEVAGAERTNGTEASELGVQRFLTLCDDPEGPFLETPYSSQAFAMVRVSIEPKSVADIDALERGLRLLHKADPSVSVEAMVTGENVLGCCGDEHLKRCITDLQKLYARGVPLNISKPLVAVRESIALTVSADRVDPKNSTLWLPSWAAHVVDASTEAGSILSAAHSDQNDDTSDLGPAQEKQQDRVSMAPSGIMSVWTANRKVCLKVSALALPQEVLQWMDDTAEDLESVVHRQRASMAFAGGKEGVTLDECLDEVSSLCRQRLEEAAAEGGSSSSYAGSPGCNLATPKGTLCGLSVSRGCRTLLFDATGSNWTLRDARQLTTKLGLVDQSEEARMARDGQIASSLLPSVLSGFHLASGAGPLCEEPMRGVAFVLHSCLQVAAVEESSNAAALASPEGVLGSGAEAQRAAASAVSQGPYGPMSGQVMVAMKDACRYNLFRKGFARICEAMLTLEVICEQDMLGKVYAVLGKRRAKVLDEGLRDGTSQFYIHAYLPLADSFAIAMDLREAASGCVSLHCAFSHWELSEDDLFQEASLTAEEIEELGDQPLPPNVSRKLVDAIRKRKGLATDEKLVKDATKQRTVTRMK